MAQFCESNLSVPLTLWAYNIYVPVSSLFTIRDDRDGVQSKNTASLKIINLIKLIINHKIFQKKQKCFTCSMFDTTYADKRYYSLPVFWGQQHLLRKHRSLTSVHNIWQNTVYYVLAWYSCCSEKKLLYNAGKQSHLIRPTQFPHSWRPRKNTKPRRSAMFWLGFLAEIFWSYYVLALDVRAVC